MIKCPKCKDDASVNEREIIDYEFDESGNYIATIEYECYECDARFTARVKFKPIEYDIIEEEETV